MKVICRKKERHKPIDHESDLKWQTEGKFHKRKVPVDPGWSTAQVGEVREKDRDCASKIVHWSVESAHNLSYHKVLKSVQPV